MLVEELTDDSGMVVGCIIQNAKIRSRLLVGCGVISGRVIPALRLGNRRGI